MNYRSLLRGIAERVQRARLRSNQEWIQRFEPQVRRDLLG